MQCYTKYTMYKKYTLCMEVSVAKTKKEFNKEAMYKKIMPSMFRGPEENNKTDNKKIDGIFENKNNDIINLDLPGATDLDDIRSIIYDVNEEIHPEENINDSSAHLYSDNKVTVNFFEILVKDKLGSVLDKFKCCKCQSCIDDIIDIALNNLPVYSFTGNKTEIEEALREFRASNNIDIVSQIIKAIILVRKKEKHNNG